MCGIAGIVSDSAQERFRSTAEHMVTAMSHRGPDSHGVALLGECVLGNTRLAIVDLSERGHQPMANDDLTLWITYNGECYNADELRTQLIMRGHRFRSETDTEVVLHLYQEFGEACVDKLRGMFAFAVWDTKNHRLFLARDRIGIKPLYYAAVPEGFLFASELKALLASGLIARKLDPAGIHAFLELGHIPPPWTAIRGLFPLEPGHIAVWQDEKLSIRQYWGLPSNGSSQSDNSGRSSEEIGDLLHRSARMHLMSDVPVALFLSGGVDSAVLGALLRHSGAGELTAITVGFEEKDYDESEASRQTARLLDIPHRVVLLPSDRIVSSIEHVIWAMDQPTVDGLNVYWIARVTAEAGYKVALSGTGGDELFGGYESIKWFERFTRTASLMQYIPQQAGKWLLRHDSLPYRWQKLSYLFGADDPFVAAELAVKILFPKDSVERLLISSVLSSNGKSPATTHLCKWARSTRRQMLTERLAFQDFHAHLEPRLVRDSDAMSMAHSLELRPVFLDPVTVDAVWRLPASLRFQKKRLLLAAVKKYIPDGLLNLLASRPKRTFTFPLALWLSSTLRNALDDAFQPGQLRTAGVFDPAPVAALWHRYQSKPADVGWSRIWSLFVLERWCEMMRASF